jgi:hypothetical protein
MNMLTQDDFDAMKRQGEMYERIIERDRLAFIAAMQNREIRESVIGFQTNTGGWLTCHNGGVQ